MLFRYAGKKTSYPDGVYRSTFHSTDATIATYTAPSGAIVFAASSIDFGWSIAGSAAGEEVAAGMSMLRSPPIPECSDSCATRSQTCSASVRSHAAVSSRVVEVPTLRGEVVTLRALVAGDVDPLFEIVDSPGGPLVGAP